MTRIVLADDHSIFRRGLRKLFEKERGYEIVDEAEDGRKAVGSVERHSPEIVIMDVSMPEMNGMEATRQIKTLSPSTKVIALSMHSDRRFVLGMIDAGASGYLPKDCDFDELLLAIRSVLAGKVYLSPAIADVVVREYLSPAEPVAPQGPALTSREREIIQLVAEGKSGKEIADCLHVSVKTVESHRRNIMEKLGRRSVADLTKYAIKEGLVSLDE